MVILTFRFSINFYAFQQNFNSVSRFSQTHHQKVKFQLPKNGFERMMAYLNPKKLYSPFKEGVRHKGWVGGRNFAWMNVFQKSQGKCYFIVFKLSYSYLRILIWFPRQRGSLNFLWVGFLTGEGGCTRYTNGRETKSSNSLTQSGTVSMNRNWPDFKYSYSQ